MRTKKGRKTGKRYCRAGAGDEFNDGMCDTPGFKLRQEAKITRDERNFLKLEMKRNHLRLIQTPLHVLRAWRGNCDVKVLLYSSSSGEPNPEEIVNVTDYVVAYACKGNERIAVEREILKDFILK
jgi:hypothetical protein